MRRWLLTAAFVALAVQADTAPAKAGLAEAGELEAARANARAGGPISPRDIELLERYGCTTGTDAPICHKGETRPQRAYHRRKPAKPANE